MNRDEVGGGWLSNVIAASCQYDRAHCRGERGKDKVGADL